MVDFAEKREYFRMNVDCEIDYRAIDSNETRKARCSKLSGAGISFSYETTRPVVVRLYFILYVVVTLARQ